MSTKASTSVVYKQKLAQAREMRGQAGTVAFDRVRLLCEVFDDREFRAERGNADDLKAAAKLDDYVGDLCCSFLELREMLSMFPRREQWSEGRLNKMRTEMLASHQEARAADRPVRERRAVTIKDYEEATADKDRAEVRARSLADELSEARARIAELVAENNQLKRDVAHYQGRIAELERIAGRELVAA